MRIVALVGWVFFIVIAIGGLQARAETRVALVIGNSSYQNVPFLPNPVNDAADLSVSLTRLGFSVKTLINAGYDGMRRALIDFSEQARGADFAVIYFAGHGIQMGGENWVIPVDAQLQTDLNVGNEAIGLQSLTRAVSSTTKLGLVILDACRSNPFLPKMQASNIQRAVERGFSRVEPSRNVLVAYSARDGTTANDGSGRNSPFTQSLLANIETPGLEIDLLFRVVRDDVMTATHGEQQPFVYGSLSRQLVYLGRPDPSARPNDSPSPPLASVPRPGNETLVPQPPGPNIASISTSVPQDITRAKLTLAGSFTTKIAGEGGTAQHTQPFWSEGQGTIDQTLIFRGGSISTSVPGRDAFECYLDRPHIDTGLYLQVSCSYSKDGDVYRVRRSVVQTNAPLRAPRTDSEKGYVQIMDRDKVEASRSERISETALKIAGHDCSLLSFSQTTIAETRPVKRSQPSSKARIEGSATSGSCTVIDIQ